MHVCKVFVYVCMYAYMYEGFFLNQSIGRCAIKTLLFDQVVKRKDVSKTFQALRALKAAKTGRSSLSTTKTGKLR